MLGELLLLVGADTYHGFIRTMAIGNIAVIESQDHVTGRGN